MEPIDLHVVLNFPPKKPLFINKIERKIVPNKEEKLKGIIEYTIDP